MIIPAESKTETSRAVFVIDDEGVREIVDAALVVGTDAGYQATPAALEGLEETP